FFSSMGRELIGHEYQPFLPYITSLGIFILACCLIGLIPSFESPTATPAVPLGCAIATFLYYNYQGLKHHGAGYIKQFIGPVPFLAPLVFLIEVVSHFARVLSLTVRLYANMFAGEMVTLAFFSLIPLAVPVIFIGLHIGVSLIQTYIFVLLTCVYLGAAVSHEH
ncbi:MAG TPA: F0F1 ATP synthase subunit A, partial [Terriglobales bacterium]|nr:F0F1 ATP synthase subunit A [Terriglobales bacterium]